MKYLIIGVIVVYVILFFSLAFVSKREIPPKVKNQPPDLTAGEFNRSE